MLSKLLIGLVCGSLIFACGCGKKDDESLVRKTGRKVGENIADFTKGIGKGLDRIGKIKVTVADDVKNLGLQQTIAKAFANEDQGHGFSVYMISNGKVYAMLCAKAFNKDDQEIGRSSVKVDFDANDAQYVSFAFPAEMDPNMVAAYHIDLVK